MNKYFTILVLFLLGIAITLWKFPLIAPFLGPTLLLLSLAMAVSSVLKKHKEAYLQGKITRAIFVRNISLEIFGILLAMALAGLLGRHIAQIATEHINNALTRLITGILIGLLAGIGVSILVKYTWGQIVKL